jgi:hypothetical protein
MRYILLASLCLLVVSPVQADDVPEKYRNSVKKGLEWLVKQQHKDGHWSAAGDQYPAAITALAGLALVAEGSTPSKGDHAKALRSAALWLIDHSQKGTPLDGLIGGHGQPESSRYIFGHGYAMAFLSVVQDDLDVKDRRRAKEVLNRAVQFTVTAQTTRGGWGYVTAKDGSNFDEGACTVSQIQGLHAARAAGIPVPREALDKARKYMLDATGADGGVVYSLQQGGAGRPALTAAALAVGATGEAEGQSPIFKKWLLFCNRTIPVQGRFRAGYDDYTDYYLAQTIHTLGDKGWAKLFPESKESERLTWSKYREVVFDNLIRTQAADGSWAGASSTGAGPVYGTALSLTILQLDKGSFPVWRR